MQTINMGLNKEDRILIVKRLWRQKINQKVSDKVLEEKLH